MKKALSGDAEMYGWEKNLVTVKTTTHDNNKKYVHRSFIRIRFGRAFTGHKFDKDKIFFQFGRRPRLHGFSSVLEHMQIPNNL